jgi:predicted nucleic acid-binding protein
LIDGISSETLETVLRIVKVVDYSEYRSCEAQARRRLDVRDPDDWPVAAAALNEQCPIWTEDTDFFGCGIATWTTDRVELFLRGDS